MICKYYLTLGSEASDITSPDCIEVSSMISNLGDVEVSHSRVGLGGVVRKIGSSIDFVGEARDRLVELYMRDQLHSAASFAVYRIENDWTFTKFFECPLDFSSFHYNIHTASCSMLDSSAAAVIKAKKSVKYELSVSDIKEPDTLLYDGMKILNDTTFQVIGTEIEGSAETEAEIGPLEWWWVPHIGVIKSNLINNASIIVSDQEEAFQRDGAESGWGFPANGNTTSYFMECLKDCIVSIDFSTFYIRSKNLGFALFKISGDRVIPLTCGYSNLMSMDTNTTLESVKWSGRMLAGEKLQYAVFNHDRIFGESKRYPHIMPNDGLAKWYERSAPVEIDVVSPLNLLDALLANMSEGGERIYGGLKETYPKYSDTEGRFIDVDNGRLKNTLLAASNSIRNIPNSKMSTSFSDFCKFMETVFGYVYDIQLRPKSGGGLNPEEILTKAVSFRGFTDQDVTDAFVDNPDVSVKFSTSAKNFIGIEKYTSSKKRASDFPGFEKYQSYEDSHGYKVHADKIFYDASDYLFYTAEVHQGNDPSGAGAWTWEAGLNELVVEGVDRETFVGTQSFGGRVEDIYTDHGAYSGTFDASCVKFVKNKKSFFYESDSVYYSSFPNSSAYNLNEKARSDMLYEYAGQQYFMLGDALTKCTVAEGTVVYVPYVYFRHRDEVFTSKGTHSIDDVSEVEYEVSDRIFSQIVIGYNKQDYDIGNNGADEFNFNNTYSVGQKLSDKKLSLLSPYRADCYGIEEVCEKRGEQTTSTGSDKQIFAVFCYHDTNKYVPDRTIPVTNVSTDTMFNAQLSPKFCVMANERYLASFAPTLKFASTEGSSEAVVDSVPVTTDVTVSHPLFGNGNISFSSDRYMIPEDWNGYVVEIESGGVRYSGYLQSLDLAADESEILKYKLIESK